MTDRGRAEALRRAVRVSPGGGRRGRDLEATDATSELRHVIEMSHDLASTLDPKDVGNRLARHIALVAHADDCVLSTWDRAADQVVTFGSYRQRGYGPGYSLAEFPRRSAGGRAVRRRPAATRGGRLAVEETLVCPVVGRISGSWLGAERRRILGARRGARAAAGPRGGGHLRQCSPVRRAAAARLPRLADRARQPCAPPGSGRPRPRAAARAQREPCRGPVHRPRQLQVPQRPFGSAGRPGLRLRRWASRPGDTRAGSAATSSGSCSRTSSRPRSSPPSASGCSRAWSSRSSSMTPPRSLARASASR